MSQSEEIKKHLKRSVSQTELLERQRKVIKEQTALINKLLS
tara:strand:+ start:19553 stop:19675 length:123 start_codon:yes stop_codon:yes gene_type:complete